MTGATKEAELEPLQRAERLISKREEDFPDNLFEARDLLLPLTESKKTAGVAYTRLSETMFWLGEYAAEEEHQEEFFGEGVEYGREAVRLEPDSAAAHLWFGANLGAHAVVRGIMASLSSMGELEEHGKRALELDETYFHAAPLRLLGRFYHQAPGFPIGPGDTRRAIELLERAVELGPDFYLNHLYLAEAYLSRRKKQEARALLEEILEAPAGECPDYHALVQMQAQELLEEL